MTTEAAISTMVVTGGVIVALLMAALWAVQLVTSNAGIVDAGWAAGLVLLAIVDAVLGAGGPRAWLLAAMVSIWGSRLAWHLLVHRVIRHPEDGRYAELRRSWRTHVAAKFFVFFEAQAALDLVLAIPMVIVARRARPIGPVELAAAVLWGAAILGEALADRQLERFKRDPARRGRVCDEGLWRYSRHPNYFFEWLIWVAYALYAAASPGGWIAWIAPALMLWFLLRFTGIPATEAQALRSRGDAYRAYQRRTSAFVPWPPRSPEGR